VQAKGIGASSRPMRIRFADFAAEWLKVYAKPNVKVRTYEA
jgi:hypothetical protein